MSKEPFTPEKYAAIYRAHGPLRWRWMFGLRPYVGIPRRWFVVVIRADRKGKPDEQ